MGAGCKKAGKAKGRKNRFDVLDRLKRLNAGLSPGQKNDWDWLKEAWDQEMVRQHEDKWASLFAKWVQDVLNDNRSNAFSLFVYNEMLRVFNDQAALHVPGI